MIDLRINSLMMMTSLFSIFDPSLSVFSFSWLVVVFLLIFLPSLYWLSGVFVLFFSKFLGFIVSEVNSCLAFNFKGSYKFFSSVFLFVFLMNFFAMFPYFFSFTSHVMVNFPLSYSLWIGIVFFGLWKSLKGFLAHLVPVGTPLGLVSFMVVVELLSNFIRPIALMFRLTANMMAGHLLMSLIGLGVLGLPLFLFLSGSLFQSLLVFMELGVSVVQAYVFFTLLLLYTSEG